MIKKIFFLALKTKYDTFSKNEGGLVNYIILTEEEIREQKMQKNTLLRAKHIFDVQGFLKIENLFPIELIQAAADVYEKGLNFDEETMTLGSGTQVSDKRYIVPIDIKPPFNDPALYANPLIKPLLEALLGPQFILGSVGAITALPGALDQHLHADYRCLFEENMGVSCAIPTYAITFAVPLIEIDPVNGPTKIWAGSHKTYPIEQKMTSYPMELLYGPLGSCYFWDYRTFHAGGSNHSDKMRSLLYMSYTRCWFKDFFNPELLSMEEEEYEALSSEDKKLFLALRNRGKVEKAY